MGYRRTAEEAEIAAAQGDINRLRAMIGKLTHRLNEIGDKSSQSIVTTTPKLPSISVNTSNMDVKVTDTPPSSAFYPSFQQFTTGILSSSTSSTTDELPLSLPPLDLLPNPQPTFSNPNNLDLAAFLSFFDGYAPNQVPTPESAVANPPYFYAAPTPQAYVYGENLGSEDEVVQNHDLQNQGWYF